MQKFPTRIGMSHIVFPLVYFFTLSVGITLLSTGWMLNKLPKPNQIFAETESFLGIRPTITHKEKLILQMTDANSMDPVAKQIDAFFAGHNAPLASYGSIFTKHARKNEIDETIVAAIAWCESNGGKVTPQFGNHETYNAWGYAVFDNNSVTRSFNGYNMGSWENGISVVSRGIKRYYDMGLIEPYEIVTRYTPASVLKGGGNPHKAPWTSCVNQTIEKIITQKSNTY